MVFGLKRGVHDAYAINKSVCHRKLLCQWMSVVIACPISTYPISSNTTERLLTQPAELIGLICHDLLVINFDHCMV